MTPRLTQNPTGLPIEVGTGVLVNPARLDPQDEVATAATAGQDGGLSGHTLLCAATINATVVKASAGRLYSIDLLNLHASSPRNIRFYDKATAPDPSADTALLKYQFPQLSLGNTRAGVVVFPHGIAFATGIAFVVTALLNDTDETAIGANECVVNLTYK